jgi:hypothetical protein
MPPTNQIVDTAYNITSQLFGPDSGIPWWAWALVVGAIMFKLVIPQRKTADERDAAMVAALTGGDGKKSKKSDKKDKKKK